MTIELQQVWTQGGLEGADLALKTGLHIILGPPSSGGPTLGALVTGLERPRTGSVRVLGADPYRSPAVRSEVASVLAEEQLTPRGKVEGAIDRSLRACPQATFKSARELLQDFGLEDWGQRPASTLRSSELRTLAGALALGRSAKIHVWHEPLADLPRLPPARVRDSLQRASESALVVVTTASVTDALELGGTVHLLERGHISRSAPAAGGALWLAPGDRQTLVVHSPQARSIAALALGNNRIAGTQVQADSPGIVRLHGDSLPALAEALTELVAREPSLQVDQLGPEPVTLAETAAASTALARAAYDAAYAEAFERARAQETPSPQQASVSGTSASPAPSHDAPTADAPVPVHTPAPPTLSAPPSDGGHPPVPAYTATPARISTPAHPADGDHLVAGATPVDDPHPTSAPTPNSVDDPHPIHDGTPLGAPAPLPAANPSKPPLPPRHAANNAGEPEDP